MKFSFFALLIGLWMTGCFNRMDIPSDYPAPEPAAAATPAADLSLKRDAELERIFATIGNSTDGEVGAASVVLETGDAAMLNADERFPMQSVYKLPIAMAVLEKVRRGNLALDEKIGVTREDMVREGMRSPLRDAQPNGGEFTIRELIRLSIVESDGTASDVLLRVLGGVEEVQSFLSQIRISPIAVANPEKEIGLDWITQYRNFATPAATVDLLRWLHISAENTPETGEGEGVHWKLLLQFMAESKPGEARLKGLLPRGTVVAHKTGTSGTQNGITAATNDIGIISLPNGKHVAIAVFVSDSKGSDAEREKIISRFAKAVWERWGNQSH
jgi:beta-lactamase class A